MQWKIGSSNKPNTPTNLRFVVNSTTGKYELNWDKPAPVTPGDTTFSMLYIDQKLLYLILKIRRIFLDLLEKLFFLLIMQNIRLQKVHIMP